MHFRVRDIDDERGILRIEHCEGGECPGSARPQQSLHHGALHDGFRYRDRGTAIPPDMPTLEMVPPR